MRSPEALGRALAAAPDPEMARVALSRVGEDPRVREALEEPGAAQAAIRLLGFSSSAADFLVAYPEEAGLVSDLTPRSREALLAEARGDVDRLGPEAGLRRFRRRALLRVATRDLSGASFEEVVGEVTAVAEACLVIGSEAAGAGALAVLGMGKLGGEELNYASDVDVIFVHETGPPEEAARSAARLVAVLSEPTRDGVALRVDAGLRPEGRAGPLSRSFASTVEYYARHAATWEKQALLKARAVAGDLELGARLLAELAPVVYPDHLDPEAIEEIRAMKARIEEHVRARGKEQTEVKRGRGGIRDVEFAVQLLQLVHGRRDERLRPAGTLPVLAALAGQGYVGDADADALAGSYRFLRTLEHRLQIARDIQTHELPEDRASLRRLARSLGMGSPDELRAEYGRHTSVVRGLHERLFYRPLMEAFAGPRVPRLAEERAPTEELLVALGFRDPAGAYERLDRLMDAATRRGRVLEGSFPVFAQALSLAPDPDRALVRFDRVAEQLDAAGADLLASDPGIARRLALVVGASGWAADALAARPATVALLDGRDPPDAAPGERLVAAAGAYVAGDLRVPESGRALSRIADDLVAGAVTTAEPRVPLAVIALGKLGGEELNFGSDLDVVFVYEGEGEAAFAEAVRSAEAVLERIRGAGYDPDPDLRPEGRNGPLARSMASYLEYWQRWGLTWEFQSLLKARRAAGDEGLARRFVSNAEDLAYPEALPLDRVAEIRRMRVRMEKERVRPPEAARFHFKLGHGGLADVTFAVELAQMRHGRSHPAVRRRHTLEALEALASEGLVEDSVAVALGEAYVFLNEVKNAIELDGRRSAEAVPPTPEAQVGLARLLGYEEHPRQAFLEEYRRVTRRARRAMERVFYGEER